MNDLFWKIVKCVFESSSEEVKSKLEYISTWDKEYFLNDNYIKIINYLLKVFKDTGSFPSESIFRAENSFSSYSNILDDIEKVDISSLSQLILLFEKKCSNRYAATKLNQVAQRVNYDGLTPEMFEELKKLQKLDDITSEEYLSEEEKYDKRIAARTGIKLGIHELDELVNCFPKGAVMTIAGFTGSFKCVHEDTLISTNYGLLTIKDVVQQFNDKSLQDLQVLTTVGYRPIYAVHDEGMKLSYKIKINGREIETSPVHRFRVLRNSQSNFPEWVEAKDLRLGDNVLIKPVDDLKVYNNSPISFKEFKKEFRNINDEPVPFIDLLRLWAKLPFANTKQSFDYQEVVFDIDYIEKNNLPNWILEAHPLTQTKFLNELFNQKGTLSVNNKFIGINSSNYTFLNRLATLLIYRGVICDIYKVTENVWRLIPSNFYAQADLFRVCSYFDKKDVFQILSVSKNEELYIESIERSFLHLKNNTHNCFELLNNNLWIQNVDEILINPDGCYMYDLSVKDNPTYVANGNLTHNTTTAANIVYRNVYENGYNFCYISLEVAKDILKQNLWCIHSLHPKFKTLPTYHEPLKISDVLNGKLSYEQKRFLFDFVVPDFNENSKGKLEILDETYFKTFSFPEITQRLEEVDNKFNNKLDGVVLDHANLCKFYATNSTDNTCESTNQYISYFRRLSIAFRRNQEDGEWRQLAVILLAQTNRQGWHEAAKHSGAYDLTALAEANELERCSTVILTVFHDKNMTSSNELKICLLKNRYGAPRTEPLTVFLDAEHYYVGDPYEGSSYEYNDKTVDFNKLTDYNLKPSDYGFSENYSSPDDYPF